MSSVTFSNLKKCWVGDSNDVLITGTYTITFSPTAVRLGITYVPTIHMVVGIPPKEGTTIDLVLPIVTADSTPVTGDFSGKWSRSGAPMTRIAYVSVQVSMQCVPDFLSITGSGST